MCGRRMCCHPSDFCTVGVIIMRVSQTVCSCLQVLLKEMENGHDEYMNMMNLEHDRAITAMRLDWERQTRELQVCTQ